MFLRPIFKDRPNLSLKNEVFLAVIISPIHTNGRSPQMYFSVSDGGQNLYFKVYLRLQS